MMISIGLPPFDIFLYYSIFAQVVDREQYKNINLFHFLGDYYKRKQSSITMSDYDSYTKHKCSIIVYIAMGEMLCGRLLIAYVLDEYFTWLKMIHPEKGSKLEDVVLPEPEEATNGFSGLWWGSHLQQSSRERSDPLW